jgi:hypothetical protein
VLRLPAPRIRPTRRQASAERQRPDLAATSPERRSA